MRWGRCLGLLLTVLLLFSRTGVGWSETEKRAALVVGNNDYQMGPLTNPANDARDMAEVLAGLGFEVDLVLNADRRGMLQAVRRFGDRIKQGGVGLFYYAGHGLQIKGVNYLVPVDASMRQEDEVQDYCLDVGAVLRKMESAENRLNIIILDACRNNPFIRSRGGGGGLARMDAPTGSLIAYATAPGAVASDGTRRNGLYTTILLKHIRRPGVEIGRMFRNVRVDVLQASDQAQVPWESSSLTGEFYFTPASEDRKADAGGAKGHTEDAGEGRDLVLEDQPSQGADSTLTTETHAMPETRPVAEANRRRVAILYFDNSSGRSELDALRKGLADMMITDLSKVPLLKLVEREKLEAVLQEQNLQATKQFDQNTAVRIGKLLGAEIIMTGGYFEMFGQLRIDTRLIDVETGRVLKAEGVNGKSDGFFGLKDQLVWRIAQNLDGNIGRDDLPSSNPEDSLEQAVDYSNILDLYDQGKLDTAKERLQNLLSYRPNFQPAMNMLAKLGW